jgi:hypothetical protein
VMFAESKAQQIAENGLLSTDGKIAQLLGLEARPDASVLNPRWLMRSLCKNARRCQLFVFDALRKRSGGLTGPISKKARLLYIVEAEYGLHADENSGCHPSSRYIDV